MDLVSRLYRFRWQLERCGKAWKSYAHLHEFGTANAHMAEGLMSTRRVAMCAHHILDALVTALLGRVGLFGALRRGLAYLLGNARRAHVDRDRRTGRLRAGLGLVEVA